MSSASFSVWPAPSFCAAYAPFSGEDGAQRVLRVALDGGQTDKALAVRVPEGQRIAAPPDLAACLRQQLQKCVKGVWLLQKRRVYEAAEQLPVGGLCLVSQPLAVVIFPRLGAAMTDSRCSVQMASLSRATALPEPRKSRNFRLQSNVVEFQMM